MTLVIKNKTKSREQTRKLGCWWEEVNSVLSSMLIAFIYLISREILLFHFKTKETGLRKFT